MVELIIISERQQIISVTTPAAIVSSPSLRAILPMALLFAASSKHMRDSNLIVTCAKLPFMSFLGFSFYTELFF
jgi:hypothetical protein